MTKFSRIPGIDYLVSADSIRALNFDELFDGVLVLDRFTMHSAFFRAIQPASGTRRDVLHLFSDLASYYLVPEDSADPFRSRNVYPDSRTPKPSDMLEEQVAVLADVVPNLSNPMLRALVADIVRYCDPSLHEIGVLAVNSYCQVIDLLKTGKYTLCGYSTSPTSVFAVELISRACFIARTIGWKKPIFDQLKQVIIDLTDQTNEEFDFAGYVNIGKVALDWRVVDSTEIASQAEQLTSNSKLSDSPLLRKRLWCLAADAHQAKQSLDNAKRCRIQAGECLVEFADVGGSSSLRTASLLEEAIEYYRGIPETKPRQRELNELLREAQHEARSEMHDFPFTIDFQDKASAAIEYVSDMSLLDSIFALFQCDHPPKPVDLRSAVFESTRLSSTIPTKFYGDEDMVAHSTSGLSDPHEEAADDIKHLLSQYRSWSRMEAVYGTIAPMRHAICATHHISEDLLVTLFACCRCFVPPGYEILFARGAMRFLGGENMEASCILIPQLERCLRHTLEVKGTDTSSLRDEGYQTGASLGKLLDKYREPLEAIFPPNVISEIDLLYDFRGGPSLRNKIAHGRLSASEYMHPDVIYGSWYILHMAVCFLEGMREEVTRALSQIYPDI